MKKLTIEEKAIKLAYKYANKQDIQTTAEARSILSYRYRYYYNKLKRGKKYEKLS